MPRGFEVQQPEEELLTAYLGKRTRFDSHSVWPSTVGRRTYRAVPLVVARGSGEGFRLERTRTSPVPP